MKTVMIKAFNKTALHLTTKTSEGILIETCHKGGQDTHAKKMTR